MYSYVLFDLDGTISDSSEGITKGIKIALESMGIHEEVENLHKFIGPPLKYSFTTFYGFNEEQCVKAVKKYREYYSQTGLFENRAYDGVDELLKKIKESGRKIAVATSKPEKFSIQILEKFGLLSYFDVVSGATMDGVRGDKSEDIEEALKRFGNPDKKDVVLVGDTRFDAEGAKQVGIECIGVLYGFGTRESLEQAGVNMIAERIEDIYSFL